MRRVVLKLDGSDMLSIRSDDAAPHDLVVSAIYHLSTGRMSGTKRDRDRLVGRIGKTQPFFQKLRFNTFYLSEQNRLRFIRFLADNRQLIGYAT